MTPILSLGTGSCAPRPLSLSLEEQFHLHKAIMSRVLPRPPINETRAVLSRVTLGQGTAGLSSLVGTSAVLRRGARGLVIGCFCRISY